MRKSILVMPFMVISLSACNNAVTPEPEVNVEFTVIGTAISLGKDKKTGNISLDWTPTDHSIECSDFTFTLANQTATSTVTPGEIGSRPLNLTITFEEPLKSDDKGDLTFSYNDKTTKKVGEGKIEGIDVKLPVEYPISMVTSGTTISPDTMYAGEPYYGEITVTNNQKILNGDTLKSVKLKNSGDDITSFCTDYLPSDDYKSATFTIPTQYITDEIVVEVNLTDKPPTVGTVIWKNDNGDVLETDENVPVGQTPHYNSRTPYKVKDSTYVYKFSSWDPEIKKVVEGDNIYTATYDQVPLTELRADMELTIPNTATNLTFSFNCDENKIITTDWGDDTVDGSKSHTYSEVGNYHVSIYGGELTTINAADYGRNYITGVQLKEGITSVTNFSNCTELTSIILPKSLTFAGASAFDGCDKLRFRISDGCKYLGNDGNRYQLLVQPSEKTIASTTIRRECGVIAERAFNQCSSLASVGISDRITRIPEQAFLNCYALSSITIPDNVVSIAEDAFHSCRNLSEVNFGDSPSLKNIEPAAFLSCKNLKSIVIPPSVTNIGYSAFLLSENLQVVDLSGFGDYENLPLLGDSAFYKCSENIVFYVKDALMRAAFILDDTYGWDQIDDESFVIKPSLN